MANQVISAERMMDHDSSAIFDVLASPAGHLKMDGSGTVRGVVRGPDRLSLDAKFVMRMSLGVPYLMTSRVKEFKENRLIAWAHFSGHRWRYELEPVDDGTRVTESFDWSTARSPRLIELLGYPERHKANLIATLERLDAVVAAA